MADTETDYIAILQAYDQGENWDLPRGFDWQAAQTDFEALVQNVRGIGGLEHAVGSYAQDASFFAEILVPAEYLKLPKPATHAVLLRVSNWGSLATVSDRSLLQPEVLEQIKALLVKCGYLYIPPSVLAQEYDSGATVLHPGARRATWWDRYFDYL